MTIFSNETPSSHNVYTDDCCANDLHTNKVYAKVIEQLRSHGYAVIDNAIPIDLANSLYRQVHALPSSQFRQAGIGRKQRHTKQEDIRNDHTCWIEGENSAENHWLEWMNNLRTAINSQLFLGLFSYESHFAHYAPNSFYQKHLDAFRGQSNRIVSTVTYLNKEWGPSDGGELILYNNKDQHIEKIAPYFASLVVFLSEEFPHEVLPAQKDRYSIAGWFRVNNT